MPYYGSIMVQDPSGWTKAFRLEKSLVIVGSAPVADIILPAEHGEGVQPFHLQLLHPQPELVTVRAVNLTGGAIPLVRVNPAAAAVLGANASLDLEDGDGLHVGGFILTLALQSVEGFSRVQRSEHLGLKLEMPTPRLRAGKGVDGLLTVTNFGTQKRCQFEIDLDGLPADCYQIDPAPLISPNGEEQLRIRFFHRGTRPAGGACPITLRMTAPVTYPTEEVLLGFNLEVAPIYQVEVSILTVNQTPAAHVEPLPQPAPAAPLPQSAPQGLPPAPQPPQMAQPELPSSTPVSPQPVESVPAAPMPQPVLQPVVEQQAPLVPAASPMPAAADGDWWTEPANPQVSVQPFDPGLRRGAARRPRLAPNQNIQVLRPTLTPDEGAAEPSIPVVAEDEQAP
jgi:hypothetical protein